MDLFIIIIRNTTRAKRIKIGIDRPEKISEKKPLCSNEARANSGPGPRILNMAYAIESATLAIKNKIRILSKIAASGPRLNNLLVTKISPGQSGGKAALYSEDQYERKCSIL